MATQPLFNRRFVRTQAVQQLYAFCIGKQSNYNRALAQIQAAFAPDVFADPSLDPAQLAQEAQQARDLLNASLTGSPAPRHASDHVKVAVATAIKRYQQAQAQDMQTLEQGLADAVEVMNQACVRIWQLLVEWAYLAKKHAEKPKLSPLHVGSTVYLSDNRLLQRLQNESNLADLIQQERASWEAYRPLVEDWYHQFVKKDLSVAAYLTNPAQEQELLTFLVDEVIYGQAAIQAFFEELDLNWAIHKGLVKKRVRQELALLKQNLEKGLTLKTFGIVEHGEEAQRFYTDLVRRTVQHSEALEALMAAKSDNWTVDRIMLLDKTIIKLALCEMIYFPSIPVKVSINEYLDIAKTYSISKSSQFINGILDAVARTLHPGDGA